VAIGFLGGSLRLPKPGLLCSRQELADFALCTALKGEKAPRRPRMRRVSGCLNRLRYLAPLIAFYSGESGLREGVYLPVPDVDRPAHALPPPSG